MFAPRPHSFAWQGKPKEDPWWQRTGVCSSVDPLSRPQDIPQYISSGLAKMVFHAQGNTFLENTLRKGPCVGQRCRKPNARQADESAPTNRVLKGTHARPQPSIASRCSGFQHQAPQQGGRTKDSSTQARSQNKQAVRPVGASSLHPRAARGNGRGTRLERNWQRAGARWDLQARG